MGAWKQAWWLTRNEQSKDRFQWLWSAIFMIYCGGMGGVMLVGEQEVPSVVFDGYFMIMLPFQGFLFSRRSFRYIQEDSYTQMLIYYRRLPISAQAVMWSRLQQSLLAFIYNGIFFYGSLYVTQLHHQGFRLDQYLAFGLTCTGFGFLITGFYIYGEFLHSGKKYLLLSAFQVPLIILLVFIIHLTGNNGFMSAIKMSKTWGLLSPLMWIMLAVGLTSLWLLSRVTLKQLIKRDLSI
ncbi:MULTISPECIES: hypothetical protein [Paenibacillus]|uniref:hypothetical protein n=1 Tax=Paenibacillus TaxID=44249 RepID=UPI0030DC8D44